MNTEVIMGGRRSGKSLELIKKSAETGIYIMAASKERARCIYEQAMNMGYIIPYPVTVDEYLRSNKFDGSIGLRKGLFIDDVDDVVRKLFYPINIHAVTFTNLYTTESKSVDMKREQWVKFNPHLNKEGEWLTGSIGDDIPSLYPTNYCSICKTPSIFTRPNYCPHCGTKMKNPIGGTK